MRPDAPYDGQDCRPTAHARHRPELVKDHDFRSEAKGRAVPYGIYDPQANTGTVFVGATADTPAFTVDCIEKWWRTEGCKRYPEADRLQILADSGGSNGCTPRAGKFNLQHPPLQPPRPARDRGSLPHGRVEMESDRTPPVLRNQQELGGTPAGQLRDHPEIPAHHTNGGRAARASASGQEGLQDRRQGRRRTNAGTTHHREQRLAEVQLHHRTHVAKMGTCFCAGPKGAGRVVNGTRSAPKHTPRRSRRSSPKAASPNPQPDRYAQAILLSSS